VRVFNVGLQVSGPIPTRGLLVCNHLSYLDILVLGSLAPVAFVSKDEVRNWPLFGWFARLAGTVFVHRDKRGDVARSSAEIRRALDDGALVALFPEGTSSDGRTVLPFKSALLEPATRQGESIYAACIHYGLADGSVADEVCYWRDMTFGPHLLNLCSKTKIQAFVGYGESAPSGLERKQLAAELHRRVTALAEQHRRSPLSGSETPVNR
jgi:1-acyl-sn-glycerol-3-phosphate acyltransferase